MPKTVCALLLVLVAPNLGHAQTPSGSLQTAAPDPSAKVACTKGNYAAQDIFYWGCHAIAETPEGQGVGAAAARIAACLVNVNGPPQREDVVLPFVFKGLTPQQLAASADCPFDPTDPAELPGAAAVISHSPTEKELSKYYPLHAAFDLGKLGRVMLECTAIHGQFQNCRVLREYPQGLGFGAAAIRMAGLFKLEPLDQDNNPVEGRLFRLPIAFNLR